MPSADLSRWKNEERTALPNEITVARQLLPQRNSTA